MDSINMARILQNMIDEACENLEDTPSESAQGRANIAQRRADLAEAVALVEELNRPSIDRPGHERERS